MYQSYEFLIFTNLERIYYNSSRILLSSINAFMQNKIINTSAIISRDIIEHIIIYSKSII